MGTTVPGGLYVVGGRLVNANGEPVEVPVIEAEAQPEPVEVEPVVEEPEAVEQPAEEPKAKRSKK